MKAGKIECGAKTRVGGSCQAPAMTNGKCKLHGGLATGPKGKTGASGSMTQWLPISSAPKEERQPFLVLLPANDMADGVVLQVSVFEGNLYPDRLDGCIDWNDRVTTATHWMPRAALPILAHDASGFQNLSLGTC